MDTALNDIAAERARQISAEGWTPEHDDEHGNGEMAQAAAAYAMYGDPPSVDASTISRRIAARQMWPWGDDWFKPGLYRRNLVKAAALIVAEIERLDRASARGDGPTKAPASPAETKEPT